jgi:hypothetical protein
MAKRVFFSFHYQDVSDFRANVVRNHWLTKPDRAAAGFFDASIWEQAKKESSIALKRMINSEIENTSVTCVLIGTYTYERPWVRYEILKSLKRGNNIIGVHINSIKGKDQKTKPLGPNPFDYVGVTFSDNGITATLIHLVNGEWKEYSEIDGRASYRLEKPFSEEYRGKSWRLSSFYPVYDWDEHDGYNNFSSWVN